MKRFALVLLFLGSFPVWSQEKKLTFNFENASIEAVVEYVRKQMNWEISWGVSKPTGTVTAKGSIDAAEMRVIEWLNQELARHKVQVVQVGGFLRVMSEEDAKKTTLYIGFGDDPELIPTGDTVRTWVFPLRNTSVNEIKNELKDVLAADNVTFATNTYSNTLLATGKSTALHRIGRILRIIDVQASERLKVKLFKMKNADAQETAKTLNDIFKPALTVPQGGRGGNPLQEMARAFGMGGQQQGGGGPTRSLASETLRITSDPRINAVIVMATEENIKVFDGLIEQLDATGAEAVRMKLYALRYADAKDVATMITQLFTDEASQARQASRTQQGRQPFWAPGQPAPAADPAGASREVRAVAYTGTNTLVVAANEHNLTLIDGLVVNLDRQLTDILQVKIYKLQNADAALMSNILRDVFRPQINATQNAGRTPPQQQNQMNQFGGVRTTSSGSGLAPSQEVEISADTRTNRVIVKASETYLEIVDKIVADLDQDATESMQTSVIDLKNADATQVAQVLQNLLRGGNNTTQNRGTTNTTQNRGTSSTRQQPNSGTRNLGPLSDQDSGPPPESAPQEDEDQRGITGQVDVQADGSTNSLVLRTSPRNLAAIQEIVKNLDRMRPQVLIKVLIAEVTLDQKTQFGVEGFWENKFQVHGEKITHRYGSEFNLPTQGFAMLVTGNELQAKLNAFAEDGKLKVLATPRVMVLDNETANINVGKQVPRITNTTINSLGNTVNTVQYENVGILLEVTPHINFDGLVTMEVHPEISDIASAAESVPIAPGVTSPTFFINSADTTVAARNGQTVIIGGLIRDSDSDTISKVPILGDIPILGYLFSNTVKQKVKRELMIFLTPYVAYTTAQLEELTELEKAKLKLIDDRDIQAESDRWLRRIK